MDQTGQNQLSNNGAIPVPVIPSVEDTTPHPFTENAPLTQNENVIPEQQTPITQEIQTNNDSIVPPAKSGGNSKFKVAGAIIGILLLVSSVVAGVTLVGKNQEVREKAAGGDPAHCGASDSTQRDQARIVGNCTGWRQANNSCAADQENPYYYDSCIATVASPSPSLSPSPSASPVATTHPDGCPRLNDVVKCLDETQKRETRNLNMNAVCYTTVSGVERPMESILVSNTRCGAPYSPAGSNMLSISSVTPNPVTYGQPVKFKATFSGPNAAKIHVRIWPNDAPGVTAMDGGKITASGQEITFDTSRFPIGTTTARVRFQLQNSSDADIKPDVAQDVTLTINTVAGGSPPPAGANATLCTTIELIKNNSIVFESSPGNIAPIINQGESFQVRVMCTTTDSADNFDKIQVKITTPSGASTQEKAARRFQERDRGSSRAFFAIFDLTTTSAGNYNIKAWGHTPTKGWKGKE